jgi:hypothetical protein
MPSAVGVDWLYREAKHQRRLWTPGLLRPALWLDAADLSTISISTGVSQWRDKGPNARHFEQGTGGNQPTLTPNGLNGLPVLSFNGSQWLTSAGAASIWNFLHNSNGSSVFAVWKAGNVADPNAIYSLLGNNAGVSANTGYYIIYDDRASASRNDVIISQISRGVGGAAAVNNATASGVHPVNTPILISKIADPNNGTAVNRSFLWVNRTLTQANADTNAPVATNASFALQVGASGNNAISHVGFISEIVILASIASQFVQQQVFGHFAWKWGLRHLLIAGHPFANRPPLIGS